MRLQLHQTHTMVDFQVRVTGVDRQCRSVLLHVVRSSGKAIGALVLRCDFSYPCGVPRDARHVCSYVLACCLPIQHLFCSLLAGVLVVF